MEVTRTMSLNPLEPGVVAIDQLPLMLTVDEAAAVLRIGRNGAYAAVADGAIPSLRIGRIIRIPRHALAALLDVTGSTGRPSEGETPTGTPAEIPGPTRGTAP
jgi:excisionase family DNA binding protein